MMCTHICFLLTPIKGTHIASQCLSDSIINLNIDSMTNNLNSKSNFLFSVTMFGLLIVVDENQICCVMAILIELLYQLTVVLFKI